MARKLVLCFLALLVALSASAQQFLKVYQDAGNLPQFGFVHEPTNDGGFVLAGYEGNTGSEDALLLKLNATGTVVFAKRLAGSATDQFFSAQQTADGGYVASGFSRSFPSDPIFGDVVVVKTDASGNLSWLRTLGNPAPPGDRFEFGFDIRQTSDGGYIVAGQTSSVWPNLGQDDAWLVKLDNSGNTVWARAYGNLTGSGSDRAYSVRQTSDGGYVFVGATTNDLGQDDIWLVRVDSSGTPLWGRVVGSAAADWGLSVVETSDGGFAVAGYTEAFANRDGVVFKTDGNGNMQWLQVLDLGQNEQLSSIRELPSGDFVAVGTSGTLPPPPSQAWIVTLSSSGAVINSFTYAPSVAAASFSSVRPAAGGFSVLGQATAAGGDPNLLFGLLDASGSIVSCALPVSPTSPGSFVSGFRGVASYATTPENASFAPSLGDVTFTEATLCATATLTVTLAGTGTGTVTSAPAGINCPGDCSETYPLNQVVTLNPTPGVGSVFVGWAGDPDCADGVVTMDTSKTCIATFDLTTIPVNVSWMPPAGGSVVCVPNPVPYGNTTTCTISVNAGYFLASFNSTCGGSLSGLVYTSGPITATCSVTAQFQQIEPIPTLTSWGLLALLATLGTAGILLLRIRG